MMMPSIINWACLCLLFTFVSSSTIPNDDGLVKIPFKKIKLPAGQLEKRNLDSTPVYNLRTQYLVAVDIGSPAQSFQVIIDTGSADLWVPSIDCSIKECPNEKFKAEKSTTFTSLEEKFNITYGSGHAVGQFGEDAVSLGGVTVKHQKFAVVKNTAGILTVSYGADDIRENPDGILGLGWPGLTSVSKGGKHYNPLLFNMMEQDLIKKPIFSISMGGGLNKYDWSGQLTLGGIDATQYSGDMDFVPVVETNDKDVYQEWQVNAQSFKTNTKDGKELASIEYKESQQVLVDTGTTLTYVDPLVAETTLSSIIDATQFTIDKGSNVFLLDCKHAKSTARLQISLSHKRKAKLDKRPLVIDVPVSSLVIPLDTDDVSTAKQCGWGLVAKSEHYPSIIGQSILQSTYLTFDMGQGLIGFAASSNTTAKVSY